MKKSSFFKSKEEVLSMFVGLLIVVVVAMLVINQVSKNKGVVDLPGTNDQIDLETSITVPEGDYVIYKVKKGEYLSQIAKNKLGKAARWVELAKINNLSSPNYLEVGQEIKLPKTEVESISGSSYTVKKGDNLWSISVRAYGDGYQWLKIWNENRVILINPDKLEIGMTLQLPQLK